MPKLSRKSKNLRIQTFAKRQYSHRALILKKFNIEEFVTVPGYISICIIQYEYFVLCSFVLFSMAFFNRFVFKYFVPKIRLLLKRRTYYVVDFMVWTYLNIKFRFCETFTVINSVIRILLIETLYKLRTIKCWFSLYLHM